MKKITLTLFAALCAMVMMATDYVGTYTVTSGSYSRDNQTVTVTKTGDDIFDVTVHNFTVVLMGEVHYVGDITFYSMVGTTDAEGYTSVSGNTKLQLSDLIDMEDLSDLGFGDISAMITGQQYPVTLNARFNYRYLTAQMQTNVVISIMGMFELLNETVRISFSGESNEEPPVVYARGDVNGDGVIDVEDVNAIVNVILEQTPASMYGGRANLTEGDDLVDVVDLNEVIELMLNQ
ncbi:MAG: hypothetical protein IKR25_07105 [Muribaculaceae bacterium]|nr:hypothetical protein [Muribaculaceae bacterium]